MPKCVYCGRMYEIPRGLTLIMKDGVINYLCSSKCRKNMLMKRRKARWVTKKRKGEENFEIHKIKVYKKKSKTKK